MQPFLFRASTERPVAYAVPTADASEAVMNRSP